MDREGVSAAMQLQLSLKTDSELLQHGARGELPAGAIAGGKVLSVPELSKGKVRQAGPGSGSG